MIRDVPPAFALWFTGLPASGKSTLVATLKPQLQSLGCVVEVLESDAVRRVLTPTPTYSPAERDLFTEPWHFLVQDSFRMVSRSSSMRQPIGGLIATWLGA